MARPIPFFLLLLSYCFSPVSAQNLLQPGNRWIFEYNTFESGLPNPHTGQTIETLTVGADTLIQNKVYARLTSTRAAPCGIFQTTEFLREEAAKIFRLNRDHTTEFQMIDFNETLNYLLLYETDFTGSTTTEPGFVIIDSFGIETLPDGSPMETQYMRIINNLSYDDDSVYKVYKDIGFVQYGLLFPDLGTGLCDVSEQIRLRCHISGTDTLRFTEFNCTESSLISSITDRNGKEIILFPNPASDVIHVPTGMMIRDVTDIQGQIWPVNTFESLIRIQDLPSGVYIIRMTASGNSDLYYSKVVKH